MITTLNKIRKHNPCADGWEKLLTYLGKTKSDDESLEITTIIDSNGLDDAIWCLRAVEGKDKETRLFAVWCARQVQHLMKDPRSVAALYVAERYANGNATQDELNAARAAAWEAAAEREAWYAAWAAMAAWVAAMEAWAAARDAAWSAARAARDAAWAAGISRLEMKKKQEVELRRICEEVER